MAIRNSVTLYGNIGKELKITEVRNGAKVARFDLATNIFFTNKDGEKEQRTEWHKIFAWGNAAKFIENHGGKGTAVCIHGRLVNRTYLTKAGKPRTITEIEAKEVMNLRA
jgi:single-strand DNA-binding protein